MPENVCDLNHLIRGECSLTDGRLWKILQRKPKPSELVMESVVDNQRVAFRRRCPDIVFKLPFAALRGNPNVVSEKEKRELDSRKCAMESVTKVNP
jgi:hypothetical protein